LAQNTSKLQSLLSVIKYGADPTGVNDSSTAFQNAVNDARTTIINNNFQNGVIVVIPAGVYKISNQVIWSPFVRIKTQGFVLINSSVTNKSTFWIHRKVATLHSQP
jgi:polygalacturonase